MIRFYLSTNSLTFTNISSINLTDTQFPVEIGIYGFNTKRLSGPKSIRKEIKLYQKGLMMCSKSSEVIVFYLKNDSRLDG